MSLRLGRITVALGLTLALVSCGGSPTASNTHAGPGDAAAKYQEYEGLKGQERRDRLVQDAKAEGELLLYTSMTADVADAVTKAFTEQTGVKVTLYRAASETVLQRLLQEASANHPGADVVETNDTGDERGRQRRAGCAVHRGASRHGRRGRPLRGLDRDPLQPVRAQLEHHQGARGTSSPRAGKTSPIRSGMASWPWSCPTTTGT